MIFRATAASRTLASVRALLCSFAIASLWLVAGCERKVQNAVVTGKDYVPASPATAVRQAIPEVWVVHIEMESEARKVDAYVTKEKWELLKAGDRVRTRYLEGNYSHTIWSTDLEKL